VKSTGQAGSNFLKALLERVNKTEMKKETTEQAHQRVYKKWYGKRIELTNTCNYTGERGEIIEIDFHSSDPHAIYGYHIKTKLDSGTVVTSHKFEGITILND
jgi:hypothetical protein